MCLFMGYDSHKNLFSDYHFVSLAYNYPQKATLGLLAAAMSIGSMLSIPVVPYIADVLGRRLGDIILNARRRT